MYSSLECIFFVAKSCGKKKETVAGRTEAKTQKRKSIKNAERQHLGREEKFKVGKKKKKVSFPTVLLFSAFFLNKAVQVWQEFTVH